MIGPLSYIGGKNRLATKIISLFPEHKTYAEPFAGGAQVFFHKSPSAVEVLNDLDFEVVNFFRVCQWHYEEFVRHLRYCLISRRWYGLFAATNPETLTDIQRASRFFYLQKNSFGGLVVNPRYHYGVTSKPNYNPERIPEVIAKVHERLRGVQIECLPYEKILEKYDRPTTLFYLDPPYWERKLYRFNFSEKQFAAMERRLHSLKGRFVLSLNDHPGARKLLRNFRMQTVKLAYTAQRNTGARYPELLIFNFEISSKRNRRAN